MLSAAVLSQNPAAMGGFDPLTLFAGAQAGAWYDPSDLTSLYQTNDTSTPVTADGQTIGRISDKSGNNNHLLQATAGSRPTYKTSGGKSWVLNSDGAKFIQSAVLGANFTNPMSIAVAVIIDTVGTSKGNHNIFIGDPNGTHYVAQHFTSDKAFIYNGTNVEFGSALVAATPYVVVATFNGTSSAVRVNGAALSNATDPGAADMSQIVIGGIGGANGLTGKVYGAIVRDNVFSAAEIAAVETYLGSKVGVAL